MTGSGSWRSKCGLGWHFFCPPAQPVSSPFSNVSSRAVWLFGGQARWHTDLCDCLTRKVRSNRMCASSLTDQRASAASLQLLQVCSRGGVCHAGKAQAQEDSRLPGAMGSAQARQARRLRDHGVLACFLRIILPASPPGRHAGVAPALARDCDLDCDEKTVWAGAEGGREDKKAKSLQFFPPFF